MATATVTTAQPVQFFHDGTDVTKFFRLPIGETITYDDVLATYTEHVDLAAAGIAIQNLSLNLEKNVLIVAIDEQLITIAELGLSFDGTDFSTSAEGDIQDPNWNSQNITGTGSNLQNGIRLATVDDEIPNDWNKVLILRPDVSQKDTTSFQYISSEETSLLNQVSVELDLCKTGALEIDDILLVTFFSDDQIVEQSYEGDFSSTTLTLGPLTAGELTGVIVESYCGEGGVESHVLGALRFIGN